MVSSYPSCDAVADTQSLDRVSIDRYRKCEILLRLCHLIATVVASLRSLMTNQFDHCHDGVNCGLWLVKLDVVSTVVCKQVLSVG